MQCLLSGKIWDRKMKPTSVRDCSYRWRDDQIWNIRYICQHQENKGIICIDPGNSQFPLDCPFRNKNHQNH